MDIEQITEHGRYLAVTAAFRVLAHQIAKLADPRRTSQWLVALGEDASNYVDGATYPDFEQETTRAIREVAYGTLRVMFDPNWRENESSPPTVPPEPN